MSLFIFSYNEDNPVIPENVYGCTDSTSCTYDSSVNVYVPGSCLYLDDCGECGGDNSCVDECEVVNGDNSICNVYGCTDSTSCTYDSSVNVMSLVVAHI